MQSAVSGQYAPDHELIITTASIVVRVSGREDIIGDISADIAALVPPLSLRGHASDAADDLLARELPARVRVALHVIVAAGPVPLRVPGHARVQHLVHVRALAARTGVLAPRVVVQVVPVRRVVPVLVA